LTPRLATVCPDPLFPAFVDLAFSQRRKKLTNSMEAFYPRERTVAALEKLGLRTDSRAEDVSVEGFAGLFAELGPVHPAA
jgi:16S rRNA A1518/A1519 N6-dimethyltransferase RsmA/KsgA/DIM1 with predicted DNA glycosylase/AP lyase activity